MNDGEDQKSLCDRVLFELRTAFTTKELPILFRCEILFHT